MIQNTAFLALITVFLLVGWLAGEVRFLAPYKGQLFRQHGAVIAVAVGLVFLNLCAAYYAVARWLFVRDAGRKLQHLDHELTASDAALGDLRQRLQQDGTHVA